MVRIKERYLLVNIIYPPNPSRAAKDGLPSSVLIHQPTVDQLTIQSLTKAIRTQVTQLYGDYGAGAMEDNFVVKYLSLATSTIILRCARAHYQMLWSALTFMDHVPVRDGQGRPCIFRVVRVSGTIRKAEEEAIRQAKRLIIAAHEEAGSAKSAFFELAPEKDQIMLDVSDADNDDSMDDAG